MYMTQTRKTEYDKNPSDKYMTGYNNKFKLSSMVFEIDLVFALLPLYYKTV